MCGIHNFAQSYKDHQEGKVKIRDPKTSCFLLRQDGYQVLTCSANHFYIYAQSKSTSLNSHWQGHIVTGWRDWKPQKRASGWVADQPLRKEIFPKGGSPCT